MDRMPREMAVSLHLDQVATICRQYGVARLALFGLILRDDFTEDSDIDVLCTLAPDSPVHTLLDWIHFKAGLGRPLAPPGGFGGSGVASSLDSR